MATDFDLLWAGVATADFVAALGWYEALWGRPADVVAHAREVVWRMCDGGLLYLVEDSVRAGHALVALAVADLDQAVRDAVGRGVDAPVVETIEGAGRKATFRDPEGNTISFVHVLNP
jgi:predicted enzyme related to lactoylglutathione lyase